VPLSEEELRLLEQMERALVEEDPKLASTLRGTAFQRTARRRAIIGGVAFAIGIAVLMTGAIMSKTIVGVLGFVVMLASATLVVTSLRHRNSAPPAAQAEGKPRETAHHGLGVVDGGRRHRPKRERRSHSHGSMMERFEERWRRRRESGGF
jgi:fatty-acid desaturase